MNRELRNSGIEGFLNSELWNAELIKDWDSEVRIFKDKNLSKSRIAD